jgi:hypothetical protein
MYSLEEDGDPISNSLTNVPLYAIEVNAISVDGEPTTTLYVFTRHE